MDENINTFRFQPDKSLMSKKIKIAHDKSINTTNINNYSYHTKKNININPVDTNNVKYDMIYNSDNDEFNTVLQDYEDTSKRVIRLTRIINKLVKIIDKVDT